MCATRPRALIVDDDAETIETSGDVVASLNHDCDTATDQENARQLLAPGRFAYVLLDLEIPVKPGRPCREGNARNLLAQIRATAGMETLPVIVMSDRGNDGPELAVSLLTNGADHYVRKPVDGDSLDRAIRTVLARAPGGAAGARSEPKILAPLQADRRELVIEEDRVTLCGIEVWRDCAQPDLRKALVTLSEKKGGRFVRIPGAKLDKALGREVSNPIAKRISDFRARVTAAMEEIGLACSAEDVIASGRGGYHFRDWIEVRVGGSAPDEPDRGGREPADAPDAPDDEPGEPLNERQDWILAEIDRGAPPTIAGIAKRWDVHRSTVNRDLGGLRTRGLIHRQGGCYARLGRGEES